MKIQRDSALPEKVVFTLTTGKVTVSHKGNRIEITIPNGQPLVVHPMSGNTISLMVGDSSDLSLPFDPDSVDWAE